MDAIPHEVAVRLCEEIRRENRGKWLSAARWQCWGCVTFTQGDPAKMCLNNQPGYRGCQLINARYDRQRPGTEEQGQAHSTLNDEY
ncbi:MAG TPA: hypothetical protein VIK33_19120 [Anaerolineae bacterium]